MSGHITWDLHLMNSMMFLYKTRRCPIFKNNQQCPFGAVCFDHHNDQCARRRPFKNDRTGNWSYSTEKCNTSYPNMANNCHQGDRCRQYHNSSEFRYHPMEYKTKRCSDPSFASGAACSRGPQCWQWHTNEDRRNPRNNYTPVNLRAADLKPRDKPPSQYIDYHQMSNSNHTTIQRASNENSQTPPPQPPQPPQPPPAPNNRGPPPYNALHNNNNNNNNNQHQFSTYTDEKKEEPKYTPVMNPYGISTNAPDKLQDDYNVLTAQFTSLQMEFNKLKQGILEKDKDLEMVESAHNILKRKCDSIEVVNKQYETTIKILQDMNNALEREGNTLKNKCVSLEVVNKEYEIKQLEEMNLILEQERNAGMDKLKEIEQQMKRMDETKEDDVGAEEKCKVAFKRWLDGVVNLGRYLELFKKNQSDDIRYIEFFDGDTIKNYIGIKHVIHLKFIMKKINEFKKEQTEFNSILNENQEIRSFKTQFEINGILTMQQLKKEIQTKNDLQTILQLKPKDNKVGVIWNALFTKQIQVASMIAPKNNEGNSTYI